MVATNAIFCPRLLSIAIISRRSLICEVLFNTISPFHRVVLHVIFRVLIATELMSPVDSLIPAEPFCFLPALKRLIPIPDKFPQVLEAYGLSGLVPLGHPRVQSARSMLGVV